MRQYRDHGNSGGRYPSHRSPVPRKSEYAPWVKYAVAAAAVLLVVIVAVAAKSLIGGGASDSSDAAAQSVASGSSATSSKKKKSSKKKAEESKSALDSFPNTATVKTFSLNGGKAPAVTHGELATLKTSIAAAEQYGSVGVVFYDLTSGKGLSYNADAEIYGASSFKGPYALFICEKLVETDQIDLDKQIDAYDKDTIMPGYTVRQLMEQAIVNSDNDSFIALRQAFDDKGYADWATDLAAEDTIVDNDGDFPTYSARSSAKLWAEMNEYLNLNTDTSKWLAEQLNSTAMSFIRSGLSQDANVYNKAGWIDEEGYEATCDAGIVQIDGHGYVMSIMTSMPWNDETSRLVGQIASDLIDARNLFD